MWRTIDKGVPDRELLVNASREEPTFQFCEVFFESEEPLDLGELVYVSCMLPTDND